MGRIEWLTKAQPYTNESMPVRQGCGGKHRTWSERRRMRDLNPRGLAPNPLSKPEDACNGSSVSALALAKSVGQCTHGLRRTLTVETQLRPAAGLEPSRVNIMRLSWEGTW